ncbi:MAG TPA: hypothetical protein VFD58_31655 [Blastocatellia bacterium]|nr:hypothetical protein [Blastocatellia bacterium]
MNNKQGGLSKSMNEHTAARINERIEQLTSAPDPLTGILARAMEPLEFEDRLRRRLEGIREPLPPAVLAMYERAMGPPDTALESRIIRRLAELGMEVCHAGR